MNITLENAENLIRNSNGKVFTVWFTKLDGSLREMNARLGVKKHLAGGSLAFDPSEHSLIPVFDMQKRDYRMIRLDTIRRIKIDGKDYGVV